MARPAQTSLESIQDIRLRSRLPTCSTGWAFSRRRVALKTGAVGLVLHDPLASELAGLDLLEDLAHLLAGLLVDDPGTAGVVAELGGVGDAVAHVIEAALIHQVDDQLQLVQALEIGALGLVAGLDQGLEAHLDQGAHAAAEDDLLAEEIGLGLLGEGSLEDAAAGATDPLGVGQGKALAGLGAAVAGGDQAGDAAPLLELGSDQVAGPLGGDQGAIDPFGRDGPGRSGC